MAKTLMSNLKEEFGTLKVLVYKALSDHPETRNSDNLLYLKCCEMLGAVSIEDLRQSKINGASVHRVRRIIQNKEGLFLADKSVKEARTARAMGIRDLIIADVI